MKKQSKKNGKFTVTEVGALIEAMRRELRPILEDIPSIKAKLDSTFEQVGKNTEDIQLIKHILSKHTEGIQLIKQTLDEHSRILNEHSKLLNEHSGLLNHILEKLESKVDRKDFEILEKKVASISI